MRNLKRALSMALAAIMVLGLMVVGASATSYEDFTDKDEIKNQEAVNTMVSLGVISGKEDGSYYAPADSLTRAEACTLIARMLGGGKDPVLGSNIKSNFTDTKGHWAETYIAYCANLGIIVGVGDGSFNPDGVLTGTAAAKMVLCALGYKPEFEGIGGANWELATNTLATKVKLYDGLESLNPSETISRDDVAQLLYNGVQAQEVEYRNLQGDYQGTLYATEKGTMLHNRFLVDKVEGVVVSTNLISMSGWTTTVEGKTRLDNISVNGTRYQDNAGKDLQAIYPVAIDSDLLGQRVVLYVQGLKDLAPNAASTKVISEPIISADNTVVETTSRLKDTDAVKDALKGSGIAVQPVGKDSSGNVTGGAAGVTITEDTTAKATKGYTGIQSMPGVTQSFIDNDADGYVDVIIAKNPALAKINTYNESKENMNISGIGTEDFVDILNPEDVAQGDYVLVYNYDDTYVLEKAETVSGVVSAYTNNATTPALSTITIDGTKYGKGSGKNLAPDVTTVDPALLTDLVDGTYTLYLDPNGNMLGYVEDEAAIGSYAVITGVNPTGTTAGFYAIEVKLLMADGTTGKYDVNLLASAKKWDKDGTGVNQGTNSAKEKAMFDALKGATDTLVTFSVDNGTVTLGRAESTNNYVSDTTANNLELKNSKSSYQFDNVKVMADNNTAFFIKDSAGDYSVVKGLKNLRADTLNTTGTSSVIYYKPTGTTGNYTARAVFATVTEKFTSNSSYAFITSDYTKNTVGAETIYTYTVVNENGETMDLKSKADSWLGKNLVQEYQMDGEYVIFGSNSRMINKQVVTGTGVNAVSVASADDGVTGATSYPVPTSAKVWNVEDTDNIFATSLQKYDKVALVLDEDGNVKTAYVYDRQDGELAAAGTMTVKNNGVALADGTTDLYNVVSGKSLSVDVTATAGQTVTVSATKNGSAIDLNGATDGTSYKVDNSTGTATKNDSVPVYTYTATENGTKIVITIAVAQDGYATRTLTYTLNLWAAAGVTYLGDAKTSDIPTAPNSTVIVNGDLTVDTALTVSNGTTITVNGDMAANANITGAGKITVKGTTTVANAVAIGADVDTAQLAFAGTASVASGRTVNVTADDALVTMMGNLTVNGDFNVPNGTLKLNGFTLDGAGKGNVDAVILGSTIGGTFKLTAKSATIVADFTLNGGTLTVTTNVTKDATNDVKLTVTTGTLAVTGNLEADLAANGGTTTVGGNVTGDVAVGGTSSTSVTVTGTVSGDLSVASGVTTGSSVSAGSVSGTVDNQSSTVPVTVGNKVIGKTEDIGNEVKTATLHDTRNESEDEAIKAEAIADEDLYTAYSVTGTKTSSTFNETKTLKTYTVTLSIDGLKAHQNADDPQSMGYWVGINVAAATDSSYTLGWGSVADITASSVQWNSLSGDSEFSSTSTVSAYRNLNASDAQNTFYFAVKDNAGHINLYNVTLDYTLG